MEYTGLGTLEQGGTITERQEDYIQNLLDTISFIERDAVSHEPTPDDNKTRNRLALASVLRNQDQIAEWVGSVPDKPIAGIATHNMWDDEDGQTLKRRIVAYRIALAARKWANSVDVTPLSRNGASHLIDLLKNGTTVGAFIDLFGGTTAQERARFISDVSGILVTTGAFPSGAAKLVFEQ